MASASAGFTLRAMKPITIALLLAVLALGGCATNGYKKNEQRYESPPPQLG
jgi:hypothetical protein